LLAIKASEDVDDGEIADVPDVKSGAGGIREHLGEEHFRGAILLGGFESGGVRPDLLPFLFYFDWVISIHFYIIAYLGVNGQEKAPLDKRRSPILRSLADEPGELAALLDAPDDAGHHGFAVGGAIVTDNRQNRLRGGGVLEGAEVPLESGGVGNGVAAEVFLLQPVVFLLDIFFASLEANEEEDRFYENIVFVE